MVTKTNHFERLTYSIGQIFTPTTPINVKDLFAGRVEQLAKIVQAVSQAGCHVVLFGERGVGKTSLANVLTITLPDYAADTVAAKVNCSANDTFSSIWKKALAEISVTQLKEGVGFITKKEASSTTLASFLPDAPGPHDVRKLLSALGGEGTVIVLDEFDRVCDDATRSAIADTIKSLSDGATAATIVLVGVADSVDQLIKEHQSVERAIVQIPMPRMSHEEIGQIVKKGFDKLGCTVRRDALEEIIRLSQGLPYIAHLLSLHGGRAAFARSSEVITREDVQKGTVAALEEWQQSIRTAYRQATQSNQPGHIYREVLLACALAKKDEGGYFSAANVRSPLQHITGKDYDIPNYAQHLKKFSEDERGEILQRVGTSRRIRYRFASPMMHAYVVIRGAADGLLKDDTADEFLEA